MGQSEPIVAKANLPDVQQIETWSIQWLYSALATSQLTFKMPKLTFEIPQLIWDNCNAVNFARARLALFRHGLAFDRVKLIAKMFDPASSEKKPL